MGGLIFDGVALGASFSGIWSALKQLGGVGDIKDYLPGTLIVASLTKAASLALHVFLLGLAIRILAPSLPK